MKRSTKGKATKVYKRGKRVSIYVHEGRGHKKSIGMITAIFWESDGTYLYYRESYQGKTLKIRWEEVDNIVPVAQRVKDGIAMKGEDVRTAKAREISKAADEGNAANAEAPVKVKRQRLTIDEIVFMLDELVIGTKVAEIAGVLEIGWQSVRNWHTRIHGARDQYDASWFRRHGNDAIGMWFKKMWSLPEVQTAQVDDRNLVGVGEQTAVFRTGAGKLEPLSGAALTTQPKGDPLIGALEARVDAVEQTIDKRNDELIDIAKSVREAPIDVVVIFSIFSEIDRRRHTTRLFASVTGRMVDVNNGRRLGNFTEKTRQQRNVAPDCSRECLVRYFSAISEEFGQEVGRVLSFKLAAAAGLAGAYKMEFVDFSAKDITEIEEFLTAFSGYQRHRVMQGSSDGRRVYWYETSSDKARLNRNLRLMLDHIGIHGRLKFEQNSFIVTRLGTIR